MCGPAAGMIGSVAGAGLGIMGAFAQNDAQKQAVEQHNRMVMQNAINADVAAASQYTDLGAQFRYDARAAQQEAYKATMAGRQNIGTALASAGTSGFDSSSLTVGAVLNDENRRIAENEANFQSKMDDMETAYRGKARAIHAQAVDRTNSMSMQSPPSSLNLALGIGNALVGGISGISKAYNGS